TSYTAIIGQYNFGFNNQYITIMPQTLYYAVVPLKIIYQQNENNAFGVGCNVAYLFNTSSKVTSYANSTFESTSPQTSVKSGYFGGLKTMDAQLALSYKRIIFKRFGANIELFYGLTNVKDKAFFNSNSPSGNSGAKLTLFYNLKK
ncbi:MAG TPA: hypothetical protein VNX68_14920, partial [Nitrosopumilaceae archaeon]|nr:hypothetical protein [Nitrosopumilaceae archaeon]